MSISDNARAVLERRYLIKDASGAPAETVEQLFARVAGAVAAADARYDAGADVDGAARRFEDMMTALEFLPNSPTLMNAGRPLGQLSACFVLPVNDTMEDIFEAIKQAALIHKSGGGTGFSFSRLRAKGASVNSTGGVASGPISFMKVFNTATEAVKQGGTRRGANMGILRADHPDILEFIDCKSDNADITNFNISVGLTERFMQAARDGAAYELTDPRTGKCVGILNAADVFRKIVDAAWSTGEPGIVFLDRMNRDNVVPSMGEIESTNPCGEQPLLPYESCNLGSINLSVMVSGGSVDYGRLGRVVDDAVHFLDNVIDINRYPLDIIADTTRTTRKIGLGVMGWADMLLLLGLPYDSDEAVALAERVMGFINKRAKARSAELAKLRGPFSAFNESTLRDGPPMRNATVTTIAPTGTLSIIAGCSSGVEPVFAYVYRRNVMDGAELLEVSPLLKDELTRRGLYSDELMRKIAQRGHLGGITEIPDELRDIYRCAHDISPEYHIRMQAAFQRQTDNAVSKTVNFPSDATREDVHEAYMLAYELGCKGVTIYRDGSRDNQVLTAGGGKAETKGGQSGAGLSHPRTRPDVTMGFTEKVKIGCGNLYVTVNYDEKGICEVFTNTGRHGGCPSQSEATSRLVSIALRSGIDPGTITEQLKGIRCASTIRQPGMKVTSCPDAIAKVISKVLKYQNGNGSVAVPIEPMAGAAAGAPRPGGPSCPECGAAVEHEGGCVICHACGYSKCN